MERSRIGKGYSQNGYGKGFISSPVVWLINGKAYAKHAKGAALRFEPLEGELAEYVPVNAVRGPDDECRFYETSYPYEHKDFPENEHANP